MSGANHNISLQGATARFEPAYRIVQKHEGGYANVTHDRGGETYRGIARRIWPHWPGWSRVDALKRRMRQEPPNNHYWDDATLDQQVKDFYRQRWEDSRAGELLNQSVANVYYDFRILAGTSGIRLFKRTLRTLGYTLDDRAAADSVMVAAANRANPQRLINHFVQARIGYHESDIARNPRQSKFMNNWKKRALQFSVGRSKVWPWVIGSGVAVGTGVILWHLVKSQQKKKNSYGEA